MKWSLPKDVAFLLITFGTIVVLLVILNLAKNSEVERFQDLDLSSFNSCNKELAFTNMTKVDYSASQRAIEQPSQHVCAPIKGKAPDDNMSIIEESNIKYNLASYCDSIKNITISKEGISNIKFSTSGDVANIQLSFKDNQSFLKHVFLLNALYLEFSGLSSKDKISAPFEVVLNNPFLYMSNYSIKNDNFILTLRLIRKKGNDLTYPTDTFSSLTKLLTANKVGDVIPVRIYYLNKTDSFTKMNLPFNEKGSMYIYYKDYSTRFTGKQYLEYFYFNQKIYTTLTNGEPLTLSFDFNIMINDILPNNINTNIFQVYMDNDSTGLSSQCSFFDTQIQNKQVDDRFKTVNNVVANISGKKNYNIVIGYVTYRNNKEFNLFFKTSNNTQGNQCSFDENVTSALVLPYLPSANMININLTVSPTQKTVLAKWIGSNDNTDTVNYYALTKSRVCNTNNNFTKIMTNRINDEIVMMYNPKYVRQTSTIELGHKNLLDS